MTPENRSTIIAVVGGIIVFALVFLALKAFLLPQEQVVNGVIIQSDNPRAALSAVLASKTIVEQINVANESEIIPGKSAAAAELASALSVAGKNVTVQGNVGGKYCVNERQQKLECKKPQVVILYGTCNCVRIEDGAMKVVATETWMLDNSRKLRGIIAWATSAN